jgi:hypothetical protein
MGNCNDKKINNENEFEQQVKQYYRENEQWKKEFQIMKKDYNELNIKLKQDYQNMKEYIYQNEQKEELVKMEMYELKKDNVNLKIKLRNHEEREKRRRECQEKILSSNKGEFTRSRSFSNNEKQNAINRIIIKPKIEEDMYENISNFRRSKSLSYRLKPMPEIKDDMYETMC